MLTAAQQHAADRFAKSLLALSDDALIDTYQQAAEDHKAAQTEGSDNLVNAYTQMLASEKTMRARCSDYQKPLQATLPVNLLVLHSPALVVPALAASGERAGTRFLEFTVIICASEGRGST
jgi:hypothetical protein